MDTVLQVEDIIKNVKEWAENIQVQYSEILTLEVLTERNVIYRAEFTCSDILEQLDNGIRFAIDYDKNITGCLNL